MSVLLTKTAHALYIHRKLSKKFKNWKFLLWTCCEFEDWYNVYAEVTC